MSNVVPINAQQGSTLAEQEEKQAQRNALKAQAADAQRAIDLAARFELEDELADSAIAAVSVSRHVPGQPTQAFVRAPTSAEYKRYLDQTYRAVDKKSVAAQRAAQELLAQSCWVYPREPEARKAMLEVFTGLLTPLAQAAAKLAEGNAEEEGKG